MLDCWLENLLHAESFTATFAKLGFGANEANVLLQMELADYYTGLVDTPTEAIRLIDSTEMQLKCCDETRLLAHVDQYQSKLQTLCGFEDTPRLAKADCHKLLGHSLLHRAIAAPSRTTGKPSRFTRQGLEPSTRARPRCLQLWVLHIGIPTTTALMVARCSRS